MSSSAVRCVSRDRLLLEGVELKEGTGDSAMDEAVSNNESTGFNMFSLCSAGGGEKAAFGVDDEDGGDVPSSMADEDGECFRGCGWWNGMPLGEGRTSVVAMFPSFVQRNVEKVR